MMSGPYVKLSLALTDAASLAEAADALHDALFRREDATHDPVQRTFRLLMWREVPELARRRRVVPFLHRLEIPSVPCELELDCVEDAVIKQTALGELDEYCLESIRYEAANRRVIFSVMGPLRLELVVAEVRGHVRDTGVVTWERPGIITIVPSLRP
jgi:hypothetical protein